MPCVRRHVIAALLIASPLLAPAGLQTESASGQCLLRVDYAGRHYDLVGTREPVPLGPYVGRGVIPGGCNDTPNARPAPDEPVDVFQAGRVDPIVAVTTKPGPTLLLGQGFLPVLRSHPLHRVIFGSRYPQSPQQCGRRVRLSGRTIDWPTAIGTLFVRVGRHVGPFPTGTPRTLDVNLWPTTTFNGPLRLHLPYLAPGSRVRFRGAFCGEQQTFDARTITVA